METLVAFCCYYRADDSHMAGRMEQFYTQALARFKDYKYPYFHKYIAQKMKDWYKTTKAVVVRTSPSKQRTWRKEPWLRHHLSSPVEPQVPGQ